MDVRLSGALDGAKTAMLEASERSEKRRLKMADVTCKPGCSGCCRRHIEISVAEASVIYSNLKENGKWEEVRARATSQLPTSRLASPDSWFKMNIPCPVLDNEEMCSAYQVRPPACSSHVVRSKADLCSPWGISSSDYKPAPDEESYKKCVEKIFASVAGNGIMSVVLHIPSALLLAERVSVQSGLTLDQATAFIRNET